MRTASSTGSCFSRSSRSRSDLALDERHDVEEAAVRLARVEQREDVRVLEVGGELDLGEEPLGADHGGELGPQDLERDLRSCRRSCAR